MKVFIHEKPTPSTNPAVVKKYDVVVVGGGMSGLIAAISSARNGAKTALIHDRSVYGGNASSETRMHISGASCHWGKKNAAETGILMELQLENKFLNDSYNYSIWDGVLWGKVKQTKNLDSFMNTTMDKVYSDGGHVEAVECYQMTTEARYRFEADIFVDATGHGTLGYFAGAEYRVGREDKSEFKEMDAPLKADGETMGNTLYYVAEDKGHPVEFKKPEWAYTFDESWFAHRPHGDVVVYHDADNVVVLKPGEDYEDHADQLVEKYDVKSGYWWIELGGDFDDIIKDSEDIRWELYKTIYGVWDHIKNCGNHGAENYDLVWIGNLPGIRESRRLVGDYILKEDDILNNTEFEDGVAYGGWPMDEHTAGGFRAKGEIPSKVRSFPNLYSIPYGCYVAKDFDNLMMVGRDISATKLAMGSTRVMGTCAVGGQAVGTAAALAVRVGMNPRDYGKTYMKELRQQLLKDDCYIPGVKNEDPNNFALRAEVFVSSEKSGFEGKNIINGISRTIADCSNLWVSNGIGKNGETVSLKLEKKKKINEIRLTFDPNLSEERCISVSKAFLEKEPVGVAKELVKDYSVYLLLNGKKVAEKSVSENYQRLNVLDFDSEADEVRINVSATNGDPDVRIFEVKVY